MFFRRNKIKSLLSDEDLIRHYQQTNEVAIIGELYQRYTHLVYGMCIKYLKDEEDSKDAVMQIFEKLLQALKNQEVQKFQNWLHVLVRNYCLMELRSKKVNLKRTLPLEESENHQLESANYFTNAESEETEKKLSHLEAGMHQIPEEQRICVEMFYLEKKCYQEIAAKTGYDLNKVKSYIQNGKRNLKIYLEKHHD